MHFLKKTIKTNEKQSKITKTQGKTSGPHPWAHAQENEFQIREVVARRWWPGGVASGLVAWEG